jgi:hypothetical protein
MKTNSTTLIIEMENQNKNRKEQSLGKIFQMKIMSLFLRKSITSYSYICNILFVFGV